MRWLYRIIIISGLLLQRAFAQDDRIAVDDVNQNVEKNTVAAPATACIPLPAAAAHGLIQTGDQSHPDKVSYCFAGQPGDAVLSFQVYDIDTQKEVDIFLNGAKISAAPLTGNNKWSGNLRVLLLDNFVKNTGTNEVTFENTQNPPNAWWWGVRRVAVEYCYTIPSPLGYGNIQGGDQSHADKVAYYFDGRAGDTYLSYQAYGIDNINEVDVFLNGAKVQDVPVTGAQTWGGDFGVVLPDALIKDASVNFIVFDNTQNPPKSDWWGVRQVSVGEVSAGSALSRAKSLNAAASASPDEFLLAHNYPNPFNPTTQIRYELSKADHVTLSIYNSLGQEVRRLVDLEQPAGYHLVTWNGRDQQGKPVPSGVYHYRLQVGDFVATKKMTVAK